MAKEMNFEALNANLKMLDKRGEQTLEAVRQQNPAAAEKLEKLQALSRDEGFVNAFIATNSAEEAAVLFAQNGLELTVEEVTVLVKHIRDIAEKLIENGGELSDEELEQISGGSLVGGLFLGYAGGGFGLLLGAMVAFAIPGAGVLAGAIIGGIIGAGGLGTLGYFA